MRYWEKQELAGAAVVVPQGTELREATKRTIRRMCSCLGRGDGFVLFSERVGVVVTPSGLEETLALAEDYASEMLVSTNSELDEMLSSGRNDGDAGRAFMPDYILKTMKDGWGLLFMRNGTFVFRPFGLEDDQDAALEAREELLKTCKVRKPIAVVWCDQERCNVPDRQPEDAKAACEQEADDYDEADPLKSDDAMFPDAVEMAVNAGTISPGAIQRRLRIGYDRAVRLIRMMERRGIVSPNSKYGQRIVLLPRSEYEKMKRWEE